MGFLGLPSFGQNRPPKVNRHQLKQIKKQINLDLSEYAKKDDIERYFNDKVTSEQRKQLWHSMSPRLRAKVLEYVKERRMKDGKR